MSWFVYFCVSLVDVIGVIGTHVVSMIFCVGININVFVTNSVETVFKKISF